MKLSGLNRQVAFFSLALCNQLCVAADPVPTVVVGQNFTGTTFLDDAGGTPPDPNGAVGPQHFVEFINGSFGVYDKSDGGNVKKISDLDFWSSAGVTLPNDAGVADPRVIYDPASQRWFASMVDFNSTTLSDPTLFANNFLIAVSTNADPTLGWRGFRFQADPDHGTFADFPTLGVDSNGVYLSGDMYHGETNPKGSSLVSIPKADLLASVPTIANRTWFGVANYAQRGDVLQPVVCLDGSTTGKILATSDIGNDSNPHSNLVATVVQNAGGPGATLTPAVFIPTAPWQVPDSPYLPAPQFHPIQPDGTDTLQVGDARFSAKVYSVGGVLYAVHNTELNGHIAIRWYRVRASDNVLLESGTIADANLDLFFPSIAANPFGVVIVAFNGSSIDTYVSCYAIAGQTINGVTAFGDRVLLQASDVSYHDLLEQTGFADTSRWGDYSSTSLDPSDPNRFWTIQMYAQSDPDFTSIWATQITELITTPQLLLSIKPAGTNVDISWPNPPVAYQLQSATNLAPPVAWANVSQTPTTNGYYLGVSVPASLNQRFFRLQKL